MRTSQLVWTGTSAVALMLAPAAPAIAVNPVSDAVHVAGRGTANNENVRV